MATKYLFKPVPRPDGTADRLRELAENDFSELGNMSRDAAARLLDLQEQLGLILQQMLKSQPALDVVEFLLRAGIDRSELLYCWQVPEELIYIAQGRIKTRDI